MVNRSRVIPARFFARKVPTGGKVELLLLERISPGIWKALVGGKNLTVGKRVELDNGLQAEVLEVLDGPLRTLKFDNPLGDTLIKEGQIPLPPYIRKPLKDFDRYQTIYANEPGSAAAPTAGLHFTQELLINLKNQGIHIVEVILHIGLDTFAPVTEENPQKHIIHTEWCQLSSETAQVINQARRKGKRIIAVGTTSVRLLESAALKASAKTTVASFEGPTELFILPGHAFQAVDGMITNFHLPRSTLLMLVSAFAGSDLTLECYREAAKMGYRFYSFGDAMLIL